MTPLTIAAVMGDERAWEDAIMHEMPAQEHGFVAAAVERVGGVVAGDVPVLYLAGGAC